MHWLSQWRPALFFGGGERFGFGGGERFSFGGGERFGFGGGERFGFGGGERFGGPAEDGRKMLPHAGATVKVVGHTNGAYWDNISFLPSNVQITRIAGVELNTLIQLTQ